MTTSAAFQSRNCSRSATGQIVARQKYDGEVLGVDDGDDLSFSDDVVEFDQNRLDFPCCRRGDRDFHLHRFDEGNLVAVTDAGAVLDCKRADAAGHFSDDLDIWHSNLPGPSDDKFS